MSSIRDPFGSVDTNASGIADVIAAPGTDTAGIYNTARIKLTGGQYSANESGNNYELNWPLSVVKSYLMQRNDGTYERVEAEDDGVHVEIYDASMQSISQLKIDMELPIFGGYFNGGKYKFLVYGQSNESESDAVEVMRIVRYDENWKRTGACSVKAVNTETPFYAGSLRMAEGNGHLYIHTCHRMYKYSDGMNHQANMTYAVNEETLVVERQNYTVASAATGYVSHSFNQFILADGDKIYRLDHGDAYPRTVMISRNDYYTLNDRVTAKKDLLDIMGLKGQNSTGVCVGGFGRQNDRLIVAGNSVKQIENQYDTTGQRNIFVSLTKDTEQEALGATDTLWITKYGDNAGISLGNPYLVMGKNDYYVMWEETRKVQDKARTITRIVRMDTDGNTIAGPYTLYVKLSGCQPFVSEDDHLVWYTTAANNSATYFYRLDLQNLSSYDNIDPDQTVAVQPTAPVETTPGTNTFPEPQPSKTLGNTSYPNSSVGGKEIVKPGRGSIKKIRITKSGRVHITLKKVTKADYYELQYSLKKSFSEKKTKKLYSITSTMSLKRKKIYYMRARAVRYGNHTSDYKDVKGKWSKTEKVKIK